MKNFGYIILGLIFLSGIIYLTEGIPELLILINLSILAVTIYMTFSDDVKFTKDSKIFYTFLFANAFLRSFVFKLLVFLVPFIKAETYQIPLFLYKEAMTFP